MDVAQSQRKQQGGGNNVFYGVLGVIIIAGLAALGYAILGGGGTAATELVDMDVSNVRQLYEQATPVTIGSSDAPVKVVEFGDYQCPSCGQFSLQVRPEIIARYVDTGEAQFVFYDFPLVSIHDYSFLAARAARCAGAQELPGAPHGAFWAYHEKLYQEQRVWAYKQGSVVGDFIDYAEQIGLDRRAFESCLKSDQFADVVTANRRLGDQLRVNSTPTILVNNRRVEDWRPGPLSRVIDEALGNTGVDTSGQ